MRKFLLSVMVMLMFSLQLLAQRTVTGKVTDEKSNPVSNASISVKGSNTGTVTGTDGSYSLIVPATGKVLIISSVDMTPQEVTIGSQSIINVALKAVDKTLSEVVVVAYGQQKKTDLTGSIATVKTEDIENKPFTSIDKALQGQVAGLQSVAASGAPGANQQIRIRGISSINAGSGPLWVIDGVPANSNDLSRNTTTANILSTLNPNDIESISVLKDAASASIYGSRASNGVILVTTRKGKSGRTKMRFDAEVGQNSRAFENERYVPLNAAQYLAITNEGLVNSGATPAVIASTMAARGANSNTDFSWYDAIARTGTQQQYNLSASGGNDKSTFYMSGGYFEQEGTAIASSLKRYTGSVRLTNKATDKLSLGVTLNGGYVGQRTPLGAGTFGNPMLSSYFILPTRSAYKPDGSFNILSAEFPTSGVYNTIALASMDKRFLKQFSLRGNAYAEYSILSNLKFKTSFGGDLSLLEEDQYNNPLYGDGAVLASGSPTFNPGVVYNPATTGRALSLYTRYFNWVWTNTLNLRQNISRSGDISFGVLLGYESQLSKNYFTTLQGRGFSLSPTLYLQYPSSASTPTTATGAISDYSFASIFSSGDVNFKNRYVLSGSFRRDGSSRFGINNRYGNFWAIGASWNIDKEAFMANVDFIDQLKLRASYGVNGNAGIGDYIWFPSYSFASSYNSAPGSAPANVGNNDLTWELNKPLNIGVDFTILKGRINFTADWYKRKSTDLLLAVPLSPTSGFASQTRNIGAMQNSGIELTIGVTPIQTKDLTWNVNFNIAKNKNKVLSLPDHSPIVNGNFLIKEGIDVQSFYTRIYAGVDPANGDPLWYLDSSRTTTTNNYSLAQRVVHGTASPTYFGALTNTITYKGFSLEAQFNYSGGNYIQDAWGGFYMGAGFNAGFNKVARIMDRWQKAGDVTDVPKYIEGGNKSFNSFSSFYLAKGDFIRLRNLQLGYRVPVSVLGKLGLSSVFFYARGTNLWTKVKDKNLGFDPEQSVTSQTNLDITIPRSMTVGVNIGF